MKNEEQFDPFLTSQIFKTSTRTRLYETNIWEQPDTLIRLYVLKRSLLAHVVKYNNNVIYIKQTIQKFISLQQISHFS